MFKEIKNFFNQPTQETKKPEHEKIKQGYGKKIAMLTLLTLGAGVMSADKILAQEQEKANDVDPETENTPTLHFENGAMAAPDIIPIDIPKIGGVIEVYLGKDYEILIQEEDERNPHQTNTFRSDKLPKGNHSIHFDKKFIYTIRDPETGKNFTINGLGLTDEDIKRLSNLSPEEVENAKKQAERLSQEKAKQIADNPLMLNKNFEDNLKQQAQSIDSSK